MSEDKPKPTLRVETPHDLPLPYSDYAVVNIGYFGIKIAFGTMDFGGEEAQERTLITRVQVGMSAEHARSLIDLLEQQLKSYEEKFGSLRSKPPKG